MYLIYTINAYCTKKKRESYNPENGSRISTIKCILEHYNIVLIINTSISIHDVSLKCLENPIRNYSVTGQIWYSCLGGSSRFMWVKLKSSSQMRMKIKKPCKKSAPKKNRGTLVIDTDYALPMHCEGLPDKKSPLMGPCAMLVVPSYPYRPNVGFEGCFSCCHRSLHFASDAQRSCRVPSRLKFWLLNTTSSLTIQPPQV